MSQVKTPVPTSTKLDVIGEEEEDEKTHHPNETKLGAK